MTTNSEKGKTATIAPWFRLYLPSCSQGFESQAHNQPMLFSIFIIEIVIGMRKGRK